MRVGGPRRRWQDIEGLEQRTPRRAPVVLTPYPIRKAWCRSSKVCLHGGALGSLGNGEYASRGPLLATRLIAPRARSRKRSCPYRGSSALVRCHAGRRTQL